MADVSGTATVKGLGNGMFTAARDEPNNCNNAGFAALDQVDSQLLVNSRQSVMPFGTH